ncbi:microcystin degradation protein MlrC [Mesorhizobium loti]|nr:M81 family metallopeptidase [Mesorhizobium loti]PLP60775.1 microcystin degradation protein MlrC [Mesorhizobium loti]
MCFTVLSAELYHETNTFSRQATPYEAFAKRLTFFGKQAIAARGGANTELGGFLDVAQDKGWTLIHAMSAEAKPSGLVLQEAFERLTSTICDAVQGEAHRLDGIMLGLHGAMVAEGADDAEGELLSRLRAIVGDRVPIAITLDSHANVTERMCALADIIVSYKTYPHVDMRDIGRQAAAILHRTMVGEIKPTTIRVALPMVSEANWGRTDVGPMVELVAQARRYEQTPEVFAVSINAGFPSADIVDLGPTVLVTCQGDIDAHRNFATHLAQRIWENRTDIVNRFYEPDEAAKLASRYEALTGPLVIADFADNPGGGGYGDSTALLGALLQAGVTDACFGAMIDPEVVKVLDNKLIGSSVTVSLGGKIDPRMGGGPLELTGTLLRLSDGEYVCDGPVCRGLTLSFGRTAVLQVEGITVLIASERAQVLDLQQFISFGIDPLSKRVIALKSMQHFRAAFEPIAGQVIVCDSGALCSPDPLKLPYQNVRRPIYPLDADVVPVW